MQTAAIKILASLRDLMYAEMRKVAAIVFCKKDEKEEI